MSGSFCFVVQPKAAKYDVGSDTANMPFDAVPHLQSIHTGHDFGRRIESIDALRGLAVFIWIASTLLVPLLSVWPTSGVANVVITQLSPSFWQGVTAYDLVLPTFLFVDGASIVPAFAKRKAAGQSGRQLTWRIVRRVVLLVAIGLLCEGGLVPHWPNIRFVGAFQRIAVCYAVAACLEMTTGWRFQAGLLIFLLLDYWAILTFGGTASDMAGVHSLERNAAAYVDAALLPGRKYFVTWDPQGILTTIPAVAVAVAGLLAGKVLTTERIATRNRSVWLLAAGLAAFNVGFLLDFVCPINPHLWTSSFCLIAIGAGSALLGLLYAALDIRVWTSCAAPLPVLGRNALITILVSTALSQVSSIVALISRTLGRFMPDPADPAWMLVVIFVVGTLAWFLNQRKVCVTV
jgi:predicted acyltransferase